MQKPMTCLILAALLLAGCDILEPERPEPPVKPVLFARDFTQCGPGHADRPVCEMLPDSTVTGFEYEVETFYNGSGGHHLEDHYRRSVTRNPAGSPGGSFSVRDSGYRIVKLPFNSPRDSIVFDTLYRVDSVVFSYGGGSVDFFDKDMLAPSKYLNIEVHDQDRVFVYSEGGRSKYIQNSGLKYFNYYNAVGPLSKSVGIKLLSRKKSP